MLGKNTIKTMAIAVAGLASVMSLSACSTSSVTPSSTGSASASLAPARVAINNSVSSLMVVIADKQGIFKKNGLDVTTQVVSDISKIPPTLGNQYDIGFGVEPLVIRGASQGLKTLAIAGNIESSASAPSVAMVAKPDSGIAGPKDMAGKTLAVANLTGNLYLGAAYWIDRGGVDLKSTTLVAVPTPNMIEQVQKGLVDGAMLQEPFLTYAKEQGLKEVAYPYTAVAPTFLESLWITTPKWAAANDDSVKAFRQSLKDAYAWAGTNEQEAKTILAEFTGLDQAIVDASPLLNYRVDVTTDDLKAWGAAMAAVTGFDDSRVDYKSLVYSSK